MTTQDTIVEALKSVKYPGYSRDIVSFGLVKTVAVNNGAASVTIELSTANQDVARQLKAECETVIKSVAGIKLAHVEVKMPAIASGKGGVGKSTCSVNIACALKQLGHNVGLLDCDIYGPSIPLMMGIHQRPTISAEQKMVPPSNYGVKLMSMGFLIEGDSPVIWRGPMIMKTVQQFFHSVDWGQLDYLLVDLPPGTGDAQLSLCQTVPLDGGVIVTTPQEASLGVVRKGIGMFEKVQVPILGIVENMSYFTAPGGERIEIFGHGGGRAEAMRKNVPFLGEVPIYTEIRIGGDEGLPVVISDPKGPPARCFADIAQNLEAALKR
jgi:ATP-binding protein involved in chromosome partitioning